MPQILLRNLTEGYALCPSLTPGSHTIIVSRTAYTTDAKEVAIDTDQKLHIPETV
jgi:hypothetical protein